MGTYLIELSITYYNVMMNSTRNISASVAIDSEPMEDISRIKYLGVTLSKFRSFNIDIHTPIATAATGKYIDEYTSNISFHTNFKLYKSRVIYILLY